MKRISIILLSISILTSCMASKGVSNSGTTEMVANRNESFGYQPIDPLPAKVGYLNDSGRIIPINRISRPLLNKRLMASLPDETMRMAIGQIDGQGNINFTSNKVGYKGSSYVVVLDYIKFDTKSIPIVIRRDSSNKVSEIKSIPEGNRAMQPDGLMPIYVGVGLRLTATISVNEGPVDLGNLFALGFAAEAKKLTGTLVIQTLGVSGKDVSSLIPMPSQINTTTIQNAIMSLAAIKSKLYEDDAELSPRVVGFYNNIGGGQETVQKFITNILTQEVKHVIE